MGRPVRLIMTSRDVIHSFYVPDFRVKQDVLPAATPRSGSRRTSRARTTSSAPSTAAPSTRTCAARWWRSSRATTSAGSRGAVRRARRSLARRRPPSSRAAEPTVNARSGERVAAEQGCLALPHRRRHAAHRPDLGRALRRACRSAAASVVADEAYLTESMMDPQAKSCTAASRRSCRQLLSGMLAAAEDAAAMVEFIRSLRDVPCGAGSTSGSPVAAGGAPALDGAVTQMPAAMRTRRTERPSRPRRARLPPRRRGDAVVAAHHRSQAHRRSCSTCVVVLHARRSAASSRSSSGSSSSRPSAPSWTPTTYNRMFTLHGVVMVWLFMIPSIPNVFGNFVLPIMIGAKDLAFPRLNLASFYVYLRRRRRHARRR